MELCNFKFTADEKKKERQFSDYTGSSSESDSDEKSSDRRQDSSFGDEYNRKRSFAYTEDDILKGAHVNESSLMVFKKTKG